MMIAWLLRPALTGLICTLGLIIHFAAYRSLKYARIDEGRSRVTMRRRSGTGCVLDQDGTHALARDIRQFVVSDYRYLCSRSNRALSRNDRSEQSGGGGKEQNA